MKDILERKIVVQNRLLHISGSIEFKFFGEVKPIFVTFIMTTETDWRQNLITNSSDSFTNLEFRINEFFTEYLL